MAQSTEHIVPTACLRKEVNDLRHELKTVAEGQLASSEQITVGGYLLERLIQLGVTTVFGVPGDYNLGFLDLVEDNPKTHWAGNWWAGQINPNIIYRVYLLIISHSNELNSAYAADGFARVRGNRIGALVTTFGVGELSAINGLAGSFAEHVPVVHIVGTPDTSRLKTKPVLHHTLGDGRFDAYLKAAEQFTVSQAWITQKEHAASEIDRVLTDCIESARPVYLALPTDVVCEKIPTTRLCTSLDREPPESEPGTEAFVIGSIYNLVKDAGGDVVVLVNTCAVHYHVGAELGKFLEETQFPVYASSMGKTVVNEDYPRYGGIYIGSSSRAEIRQRVEGATLIIHIGSILCDNNTANFTHNIPKSKAIELHSDDSWVLYASYPGIGYKRLLPKLTAKLAEFRETAQKISVPPFISPVPCEPNDVISQAWLWPRIGQFLKANDVVLAETGTLDVPLPNGATLMIQVLWASIGYTVGALLGAACGARDRSLGRVIVFVGDGSLQLTVQELSTVITNKLTPIVFVLNNSGYATEKVIKGAPRKYLNIASWDHTQIFNAFTRNKGATVSYTVKTKAELDALLEDETFNKAKKAQLVELIMLPGDAPPLLLGEIHAEEN